MAKSNVYEMVAAPKKTKNQQYVENLANFLLGEDYINQLKQQSAQKTLVESEMEKAGYRKETVVDRLLNTEGNRIGSWINESSSGSNGTSKDSGKSNTAATITNNSNVDNYYNDYYGYGGGGAGVSGPQRIDLTDILASYEQGAAAQRKTIEDTRESQRQSLLSSLKRFQDETAEARNQQRRSYNSSRADLEGQAFMANRQALQSAASRGLGGSGLQQLAQLQNLINQSAATDKLAQSNTDVLKQIASAAQSKEEDTNTAIQNLAKEAENKLATIDANTAQARANLQYQEAVRYEQARQAAEQFAAQLAASNAAAASSYAQDRQEEDTILKNLYTSAIRKMNNAYENTQGKDNRNKETTDATKAALDQVLNEYQGAFLSSANPNASTYAEQLDRLYNKFYNR